MGSKANVKPLSQLMLADFQEYPVWTWYENDHDESLVTPVENGSVLSYDDYGAVFIFAELMLNDGTMKLGDVSVNLRNRQVYALEIFQGTDSFMLSNNPIISLSTLSQLSEWLQKPVEAITPLEFKTDFTFEDGEPIAGKLKLQDW